MSRIRGERRTSCSWLSGLRLSREKHRTACRLPRRSPDHGFCGKPKCRNRVPLPRGQIRSFSAADLKFVQGHVQVIVAATGTNGVLATTAATKTIPIVFAIAMDPVSLG